MVQDMTTGAPWRHIIRFAVPLLLGNLFQAAYNMVDTAIVGQFAGPSALAGVGAASPVFQMFHSLLMGLSIGSGIVISQLFGGRKKDQLPRTVSTILWISLFLSVFLTVLSQLLAAPLLLLLKTPAESLPHSKSYLGVLLWGLVCSVFYNQLTGMLRGLGDTKTPLYVLLFSNGLNGALDFLLVGIFQMGAAGAAAATVAAEGSSALLLAVYIKKAVPLLHPSKDSPLQMDHKTVRTIFAFGLPMGLQQASISFGHLLLQGIINPFGTNLIAAYASAAKIDTFAVMPILSISSALSTYSAQNCGAGNLTRIRQGCRIGCQMVLVICLALAAIIFPFRNFLLGMFVSVKKYPVQAWEIIALGSEMLSITSLFYWLLGPIHVLTNAMAGAGDTKFSMKSMIGLMSLRVIFAWCFVDLLHMDQSGIWLAFPASWALILAWTLIHYVRGSWQQTVIRHMETRNQN